MQETKSLHDYEWPDFPGVINRILMGQAKLFALISADENFYFIPENDPDPIRSAKSGRYEISDTNLVIEALEQIYRLESDTDRVRLDFSPHMVELRRLISPDGEPGNVADNEMSFEISPPDAVFYNPLKIPFSRIIVQDSPAKSQMSGYEINTPEYEAIHAVYGEFWADGKNGQTKDNIVAWIITEFSFSKKTAEVIDTICRPENRRGGGNVKLKRV